MLCKTGNQKLLYPQSYLPLDLFKKIIDENKRGTAFLVLYNMGEPFLHGNIFDMIEYAWSRQIYTKISSNGYFKKEMSDKIIASHLDELLISLDFVDAESYVAFKGKDVFYEIIKNIKELIKLRGNKRRPFISVQLLFTRQNEDTYHDFVVLCRELNVDEAIVKKVRIDNCGKPIEYDMLPKNNKYVREVYTRKNRKKLGACIRPWISAMILSDGSFVPCCIDSDKEFFLGNITTRSFEELWWGKDSMNVYRNFIAPNNMCTRCSVRSYFSSFVA